MRKKSGDCIWIWYEFTAFLFSSTYTILTGPVEAGKTEWQLLTPPNFGRYRTLFLTKDLVSTSCQSRFSDPPPASINCHVSSNNNFGRVIRMDALSQVTSNKFKNENNCSFFCKFYLHINRTNIFSLNNKEKLVILNRADEPMRCRRAHKQVKACKQEQECKREQVCKREQACRREQVYRHRIQ